MNITDVRTIDTQYFANRAGIAVGDILGEYKVEQKFSIVDLISDCDNKSPVGISLNTTAKIDDAQNWNSSVVFSGGKIHIMTEGQVVVKMAKSLKLPYKQPIYVNLITSKLDFKKLGPAVGRLVARQDEDGFCKIEVDFR